MFENKNTTAYLVASQSHTVMAPLYSNQLHIESEQKIQP